MRFLCFAFVLLWPVAVVAADFNAGVRAYKRGNYATAMREFRPLAEQGHAAAQYKLGFMYGTGKGMPKDNREAVTWYRKAAEQGFALAQYDLGNMYARGQGVPKDNREAAKWYRKAAAQGDAPAQYFLGNMYGFGKGVPKDNREAVKWYRKAAAQGFPLAQYDLGNMYAKGKGVPKDDREAAKWYHKAAEQGFAPAQVQLGFMYNLSKGVPKDYVHAYAWFNLAAAAQGDAVTAKLRDITGKVLTPSQIARAQSLSKALVQRINAAAAANSTGTPAAAARPATPSRYLVKEAQTLLARIGYRPGPADGLPGRRTEHAVKAFQSALKMTPNGIISDELVALLRIAAATAAKGGRSVPSTDASRRSSGSGFFVSTDGHLVTNRHVIEGCGKVTVTASGSRFDATVLSVDGPNDLALLKAGGGQREPAVLRSLRRAALGERVTVAGFPLSGLLADDLNVTSGAISALAGLGNNPRVIQITAPVQSGNSGSPLLDKSGQVIGVVVSKLNVPKVYKVTGELPQNINFAVKGTLLRGFLDIHGVNYRTGDTGIVLSGETVAAKARRFVVSVGCWK